MHIARLLTVRVCVCVGGVLWCASPQGVCVYPGGVSRGVWVCPGGLACPRGRVDQEGVASGAYASQTQSQIPSPREQNDRQV